MTAVFSDSGKFVWTQQLAELDELAFLDFWFAWLLVIELVAKVRAQYTVPSDGSGFRLGVESVTVHFKGLVCPIILLASMVIVVSGHRSAEPTVSMLLLLLSLMLRHKLLHRFEIRAVHDEAAHVNLGADAVAQLATAVAERRNLK